MTVKTTVREAGSVTIVDLAGRVTLGASASTFGDKIRELTAAGKKQILLNLADLSYLDSSGIGELVASVSTAARAGGSMKLLNPQKRVREILDITHVSSMFEIFDNEAAGVKSFAA